MFETFHWNLDWIENGWDILPKTRRPFSLLNLEIQASFGERSAMELGGPISTPSGGDFHVSGGGDVEPDVALPFKVVVHYDGQQHEWSDIPRDTMFRHFEYILQGKFNILCNFMFLEVLNRNVQIEDLDLEVEDIDFELQDFFNEDEKDTGDLLEFELDIPQFLDEDSIKVNVVENFGARRHKELVVCPDQESVVVSFAISGAFDIPEDCVKVLNDNLLFDPLGGVHEYAPLKDYNIVEGSFIYFNVRANGGTQKKRKCTISEMKPKPTDPKLVSDIFKVEVFNDEAWLETLPKETLNAYYKDLQKTKGFPAQVQVTVDYIREFKALKDFWVWVFGGAFEPSPPLSRGTLPTGDLNSPVGRVGKHHLNQGFFGSKSPDGRLHLSHSPVGRLRRETSSKTPFWAVWLTLSGPSWCSHQSWWSGWSLPHWPCHGEVERMEQGRMVWCCQVKMAEGLWRQGWSYVDDLMWHFWIWTVVVKQDNRSLETVILMWWKKKGLNDTSED